VRFGIGDLNPRKSSNFGQLREVGEGAGWDWGQDLRVGEFNYVGFFGKELD